MKCLGMERGQSIRGSLTTLGLFLFLCLAVLCWAEEDFNCHEGGGLSKNGNNEEKAASRNGGSKKTFKKAAIIPKGDIIIDVGANKSTEVLCRFNSSALKAENVFFATKEGPIPHETVNSSTIRIYIQHFEPKKYILFCRLRRKSAPTKELCSQVVKAGGVPADVENFSCVAPNNEVVNCSWTTPYNPVKVTQTNLTYSTPNFMDEGNCPLTNMDGNSWCYWDRSNKYLLRDEFKFTIYRKNALSTERFEHKVFIPAIVYPKKVTADVTLVGPIRVKVAWNLTYPMDVFSYGLYHRVEYKMKSSSQWLNVTNFFHKHKLKAEVIQRTFDVEVNMPHAYVEYEFRVRIHTGYGELKEELWSPYDALSIMTEPVVPSIPPETSKSTFEIVEHLDNRDIYVNFRDIEELDHGGRNFAYSMLVYPADSKQAVDMEPSERTKSYFKYTFMNFTDYRFEIFPLNEKGRGSIPSIVRVPISDCLPKKTDMFTVIIRTTSEGKKVFSLYWVPSSNPNIRCPGADLNIDSYTIFWCKKTSGDRCKETLYWQEVPNPELVIKELSEITISPPVMYEKNLTDLAEDVAYTFGVAAGTGNYSSGIRWSSCIVDENEPPVAPITEVATCTTKGSVEVKWNLKCSSLSAIPLGFNVSYCMSDIPDFGHCTSPVANVQVNSPSASSRNITNLTPGISYIFSVSVLSLIGEGRQSLPKLIKLREEIPSGPPTDFKIESMTATSIVLSWRPPLQADQNGILTEYLIVTIPISRAVTVLLENLPNTNFINYEHGGLKPLTEYEVRVKACNKAGCGDRTPASLSFRTRAGKPDEVDNFILDVSNWRLLWSPRKCNSYNCSFEVKVPLNETSDITYFSGLNDSLLSLHDVGLPCNKTIMKFHIRSKGQDENGRYLYSNWSSVEKEEDDCPQEVNYVMIGLVCSIAIVVVLVAYLIMKFGWSAVKKAIKDCKQSINLPKGIQATESVKEHRKDFSSDKALIARASEPSFLLLQHQNSQSNLAETILREDRVLAKLSRDSVSSEEVNLIDATDHDRHGRNLSGGSGRSSGNDSAMMSESPSGTETDQDAMSQELDPCQNHETTLRQRNPVPAYVQHGVIPEKISEGYVTAHSVPSLPHLYIDGLNSLQQSTPNLNANLTFAGWVNARRASTGYISMPESETDSPMRRDPLSDVSLSRVPPSRVQSAFPPYSRYSFNPNLKLDESFNKGSSPTRPFNGYTVADIRPIRSPSPPSQNGNNMGYVSAGDPFGVLKRQPSLPLIPKNIVNGEEELPLGAYCRVGSRANNTTPGYVSAGPVESDFSALNVMPPSTRNPYVSYGEAAMISSHLPPSCKETTSSSSPYVELCDGGRWAQPVTHSMPLVSSQRLPTLSSSSKEGSHLGRIGQLQRPNTTEAATGRRKVDGNPSLSKQSSGYVSQETIPSYDSVVMSPKRLMTQAVTPHTVIMSPSHQASMV